MEKPKVAVIRTGLANLASVLAGLRRAGADPYVTESPEDVRSESHVMLPGVGAFGAAMERLHECGIVEPFRARLQEGRPTLSICLGLQLLCRASAETPGVEGIGFVDAEIIRFPETVRVPQLGWNEVAPAAKCEMLKPGYAYFANSYCLPTAPAGWNAARTEHGIPFVSAMEKGALLACQFHPELSGEWGLALLKKWVSAQ
ncbi:imidazole glycerol phosphate synthase subunit HisH [soil metagenome]